MPIRTTYDCSTGLLTEEEVEATSLGDKDVPEPPDLVAAVQELTARLAALEARLEEKT